MNSAILVAAGIGTRMGAGVDKLFLKVAGRSVVAHTWQRFDDAKCIGEIILVVREGRQRKFKELAAKFRFQKTVSHRYRWCGKAGFSLERFGGALGVGGGCRHS